MRYDIKVYETRAGRVPFNEWLDDLSDVKAREKIIARLQRVALGNFGISKMLGDGISELKIDFGPGYRVYFAKDGKTIILVLCANSKRTQQKDIEQAKEYFNDFKLRGKSYGKS